LTCVAQPWKGVGMNRTAEKIVIVETDPTCSASLVSAMRDAGFDATSVGTLREALDSIRDSGADLVLVDVADSLAAPASNGHSAITAIRGSGATEHLRLILLVGPSVDERVAALDLGADDAISRPWVPAELLARVRTQMRAQRADRVLIEKAAIAEEGQKIAQTAFGALAVTEKMTEDATSLDRRLKRGVTAVLAIAGVMAAIYFLFARNTSKSLQLDKATISRLEGNLTRQEDLMAEARRLRSTQAAANVAAPALGPTPGKSAGGLGGSAAAIISQDVQSVCLLHVSVAFRNTQSGRRLRYAGLNQQGDPLQDSEGNPILTLEGNGPEVKLDVFGTGFTAAREGRIMTNRHVAEPWWKNEKLGDLASQGLQAEISEIHAYFPGDPRAFKAEIQDISKDTDLATMRVDVGDLKRPVLSIDPSQNASRPGEAIVLMGYATGLAAILARTDEDTAQQIVKQNAGAPSRILDELARRNLIRPLITQGHIGDVLPDKIVFDAQTTSGGSGGPLFNQQGKVIGVTYAVLEGFGGSNFGIPIRFSEPLLAGAAPVASN
jgi:DNA-binding response OmpR family regulator/S1-C subfamily serine protease